MVAQGTQGTQDKGMSHDLGRVREQDGTRFHHAARTVHNLKLNHLFLEFAIFYFPATGDLG